ncbi:MAG TPA: RES family NAD+ phosphorylase [Opitutaceae bacterium]|nr:RES family NAD+ phosphorylase [Opitutaceae bacterium]
MARDLRRPLETADFNLLALEPLVKDLAASWWNLRWAEHDKPGKRFFATMSGRLTPSSGTVPCLYLAETQETSFYEIYGDVVDAAQKRKQEPRLTMSELEQRVFLKNLHPTSLKLYDLTEPKSAKKIGTDLATLYAPDVGLPRLFAQRLHDHPARFDGIQYISRHTQGPCIVLWATHTAALNDIKMERTESLWDLVTLDRTLNPASMRLFDTVIEVAASP